MRTTPKRPLKLDLLHAGSILVLAAIIVIWCIIALGPAWESFSARAAARLAGYVAFIAMLVPYLHILRRCFRYRPMGAMTAWLRWHIGAAYVAFFMVLVHSQGRASEPLTQALLWLTWLVMISGAVGFYGQKMLYLLLPRIIETEYGLERLEPQRQFLIATATDLVGKQPIKRSPEVIQKFCSTAMEQCFAPPFALWRGWLRDHETLSENWYQRTRTFADAEQGEILHKLWTLIRARRSMNLEYRLHQVGRLWLLVHGPAAWVLLLLMIEHAVMSMWYGGF